MPDDGRSSTTADVAVVGAGPNGLAAAVTLARAGLRVDVLERNAWAGGGASTREITVPGYRHDLASAVHPMALASSFFREFRLNERIDLLVPELSFGHPLPDGRVGLGWRDLDRTADGLGADGPAYRRLLAPLLRHLDAINAFTTASLLGVPRHPWAALLYGLRALEQGTPAWNVRFRDEVAPALITGTAGHVIGRHPRLSIAGGGLALTINAHGQGWPVPRGGSQAIADALVDDLTAHGGRVLLGQEVTSPDDLAGYGTVLLDVSVRTFDGIYGERLPQRYRTALRGFRHGNGASKVDFALSGPVPWTSAELRQAPTIHLGGTRAQIAASERAVAHGRFPANPYVLVTQPSVIDPTRAPEGGAVLWAYSHVPYGSPVDMTEAITAAVERYAPGFRDLIVASTATPASRLDTVSPNFAGGDFATGAVTMRQMVRRPVLSPRPWRTPLEGVYLASSATTPGPSVHGLAGWYAARLALSERFGLDAPDLAPRRPVDRGARA
ncbi:NAD(P)/FAD-dependent oxidoreductase [Luteipulveratus sp. YIM 133132]|uniref:phytoene desaturase family protein n=1 Tax=Luteipulveratus flavus TaxID=3031728 RepID=UPI0023B0BB4C|nr:NAD(P)/FAD-dependent oxidoreductase [Luteipulveratus sp. YIM 133132]MDE9364909.1 NAD(P)/FAD-dependent oxidoreductase [Luteipulveratus sp. YIM 133132]